MHLQDEMVAVALLAPGAAEFHKQVKDARFMCYQILQIEKPIKLI